MPLPPGTRFGPYEILAPIGAGGMGEVYKATDTNLKRAVALKVLPASVAADAERLARFQREAEVLAALNHPNIAAIYGLEKTVDCTALVMELVDGEDLSTLISRHGRSAPAAAAPSESASRGAAASGGGAPRALSIDDALPIAKQIAEALEAAHEQGIIHRDLKPANVKVRADGTVKVLDFGLAKALDPVGASSASASALANSPTMTSPAMTQMGMILGTAAYMAPEQARGKAVDRRADIWAFGAVLFEMLTGQRAFAGDDITDTLAAVVRGEPDWHLLPPDLSPTLAVYLRRCLQKDPKQRIGDIHDVRLALDGAFDIAATPQSATPPTAPPRPLWRRALPVLAAVIVTAALVGAGVWYARPAAPTLPITRFRLALADGDQLSSTGRQVVAISRDGTQIVYSANQRLYRRLLSELDARVITGTDSGGSVTNPVFSPDGQFVAYFSSRENALKKIAVTGGAAQTLAPMSNPFGLSWSEDGILVGQGSGGVIRVPEGGGKPERLVTVTPLQLVHGPQLLPGGRAMLYTVTSTGTSWDQAHVVVQSLAPGSAPMVVIEAGADARYVSIGYLVYASSGTLLAVPFDLGRLKVTGAAVKIVDGVMRSIGGLTGTAQFAVSDTGSLVYVPGSASTGERPRVLAFLNRRGGFERLPVPPRSYAFPRVSPDGTRIAASTEDSRGSQVWILDLTGSSAPHQLTTEGTNSSPVWSPDGQRVAFQSTREGDAAIFSQRADGAGVAERLTKPDTGIADTPDSWSPDGQYLAFTRVAPIPNGSLWILSLKDKTMKVFAEKPSSFVGRAAFSPDGKWLAYQAYQAGETGRNAIFVEPFPATGAKHLVTMGGHPFWSPDGRELVINPGAGQISTVSITTQPNFSFGPPVPLPGGLVELASKNPNLSPRPWDYAPDGKRIFGVADLESSKADPAIASSNQIQVVVNWFEELRRLALVK